MIWTHAEAAAKTRKKVYLVIGRIQEGTSKGGEKRPGRESKQSTSMSRFPQWATGAPSVWEPLGDCVEHISELSHRSGEEAGVFILPSTPVHHG